MTSLKQKIGSLLTEVEKFLVETLKGVKLNGGAKDEKDRILEKVRQLLEEIPGSSSSNLDNSYASGGSHKTSGGGDSGSASGSFGPSAGGDEEVAYNDDIAKIAASDLKNKLQSGLLDKKKKSLAAALKSWDHLYCVISHNIFYMYKKQGDAKQKEAFCLNGYEFHEAPGLEKDASKKEMCFELTKTGAPSYQFRASSKEGLVHWREAITKGIQMGPEDDDEPGETYEDVGHDSDSGGNFPPPPPKEEEFDDPDDIYEECGPDNIVETKPPPAPVSKPPSTPVSKPPPKPSVAEDPEELYDDATSTADLEKTAGPPPLPPGNRRREVPQIPSSSEPAPPPPPKADLPPIPKSVPPPIPERRPSSSDPPPLPSNPPPLPGRGGAALRVPQLKKPFMDRDEDFENVYFGKWDCDADTGKELSFKQGDLIHVLSRDFDAESWWVGEVQGKIGLVPKDFLHPAFALVA